MGPSNSEKKSDDSALALSVGGRFIQDRHLYGAVLVFCLIHFALRFFFQVRLGHDDSEQALFGQFLSLVYRSNQPPLYTWLVFALSEWFGASTLLLHALRQTMIAGFLCSFIWATGQIPLQTRARWIALGSLFLLYPVGWIMQINLTHTLLLLTFTLLSTGLLLKLMGRKRAAPLWSLLLGLFWAAGLLSKYTFILVLIAHIISVLVLQRPRLQTFFRLILPSAVVALMLFLPHALAWWEFREEVWYQPQRVVNEDAIGRANIFYGAWIFGVGILENLFPLLLAILLIFLAKPAWQCPQWTHQIRFLILFFTTSLLLASGVFFYLGGDQIRVHWLLPVTVWIPAIFPLFLNAARLQVARLQRFAAVVSISILTVMTLIPIREMREPKACHGSCHRALDFEAFAKVLKSEFGDAEVWLFNHSTPAGNIALQVDKPIIIPLLHHLKPSFTKRVPFIWQVEEGQLTAVDPQFREWQETHKPEWLQTERAVWLAIPFQRNPSRYRHFAVVEFSQNEITEFLSSQEGRF